MRVAARRSFPVKHHRSSLHPESNRAAWNGIDLITLRLLLSACEEGNLARVAARENIALSALSKRITLLEDRFGVELFHRHDRGVRPTATMNLIWPQLKSMFVILEQVAADLRATSRGEMGLVRVQAHMTAFSGILADRIAAFLRLHPKIDVELDEATSTAIVHSVQVSACDIGFVSGTVDVTGLERIAWAHDELVVVLPSGHELGIRQSLRFLDLLDFPFIAMQRDSALVALFRAKAAEAGKPLLERTHVTSFDVAKKMVRNGLGLTVIPATSVYANDTGIVALSLQESWARRELVICARSTQRLSHSASLFLQFLSSRDERG